VELPHPRLRLRHRPLRQGRRTYLGLSIWGYDLAQNSDEVAQSEGHAPNERIFSSPPAARYDIIISREVVEHFVDPRGTFQLMKRLLKPGGVIAFQTNLYVPSEHDRTWGYIGPMNGHISLYSRQSLRALQNQLGVSRMQMWRSHDTVVAWKLRSDPATTLTQFWLGLGRRVYERARNLRARYT